jgi:hypothetical protein
MAQAAAGEGVPPRSIGFKATLQVLEAFRPQIAYQAHRGADHQAALYAQVLRAIVVHRVADRPDRFEPRMAKRRPKRYDRLTRPRAEIKLRMLKRVSKIEVPFADQTEERKAKSRFAVRGSGRSAQPHPRHSITSPAACLRFPR